MYRLEILPSASDNLFQLVWNHLLILWNLESSPDFYSGYVQGWKVFFDFREVEFQGYDIINFPIFPNILAVVLMWPKLQNFPRGTNEKKKSKSTLIQSTQWSTRRPLTVNTALHQWHLTMMIQLVHTDSYYNRIGDRTVRTLGSLAHWSNRSNNRFKAVQIDVCYST